MLLCDALLDIVDHINRFDIEYNNPINEWHAFIIFVSSHY